jgi:hypothetical protein
MDGWSVALGVVGGLVALICISILNDPAKVGETSFPDSIVAIIASFSAAGMFLVFANPVLLNLWPVPAVGLFVHALFFGAAAWMSM